MSNVYFLGFYVVKKMNNGCSPGLFVKLIASEHNNWKNYYVI